MTKNMLKFQLLERHTTMAGCYISGTVIRIEGMGSEDLVTHADLDNDIAGSRMCEMQGA